MPSDPRHIVLCADDYALNEGVDRAIVELAIAGRLEAVSCMTRSPRWRSAAPVLRDLPAGVQTGVHLNLTEAGVGAADDFCRPLRRMLLGSIVRMLPREPIRDTIERHLDAYEAAIGRPPSYVDGHQHVHQFPVVLEELAAAMRRRYPTGQLPWLRATDPPPGLRSTKARVIVATRSYRWRAVLESHGIRCNPAFIGVYDFAPSRAPYEAALDESLVVAPANTLMMCHPAKGPASPDDTIAAARRMEYEFLASQAWSELLLRTGCSAGVGFPAATPVEVSRA